MIEIWYVVYVEDAKSKMRFKVLCGGEDMVVI